jgi:hypothetical protein
LLGAGGRIPALVADDGGHNRDELVRFLHDRVRFGRVGRCDTLRRPDEVADFINVLTIECFRYAGSAYIVRIPNSEFSIPNLK